MSAANNGKKKPLILGNNTFNFIANMASRSLNQGLIDSDTSKTEDYVSSADSDRELVQMDDDHRATTDSKEINQLENSLKFLNSCDDPTTILTDVEIVNERLDTIKQPEWVNNHNLITVIKTRSSNIYLFKIKDPTSRKPNRTQKVPSALNFSARLRPNSKIHPKGGRISSRDANGKIIST